MSKRDWDQVRKGKARNHELRENYLRHIVVEKYYARNGGFAVGWFGDARDPIKARDTP